jgi:hypothetical protein
MKNDEWSNNISEDIYVSTPLPIPIFIRIYASFFICIIFMRHILQQNVVVNLRWRRVEMQRGNLTHEEENIIFMVTVTKRTIVHGHGYMAKYPTTAELMDAQIEQACATAT